MNNPSPVKAGYKTGMYFDSVKSYDVMMAEARKLPPLTREEEQALAVRCENKDREAMDKLVAHNIMFAAQFARKYGNENTAIEDLTQEAILGMYEAAKRFTPRGFKFITYARWWIWTQITQYLLQKSRTVKTPINVAQAAQHIKKYARDHGDPAEATHGEIRSALGLNPKSDYASKNALWEAK